MNAPVDPRASTVPPPPSSLPRRRFSVPPVSRAFDAAEKAAFGIGLRLLNAETTAADLYAKLLGAERQLADEKRQRADEVRAHKRRIVELELECAGAAAELAVLERALAEFATRQ